MEKLVISDREILKGENVTIDLKLPNLYHSPMKLPIHVIKGKKKKEQLYL